MKSVLLRICFCVALGNCCDAWASAATVSYTVTFDATWSQSTHPNAYPAGAHFSSLIGGVHSNAVSFWNPGGLASAGIEQMAEIGGTTALRNEVQTAINAGTASAVIQGSGVNSPGSTSSTFQVTAEFPLITLVTMVAPSPDWFVGVHGFDLRNGGGWTNYASVDLFPYDAGTEQGTGFSLSNPDTVPHQPIALLGTPFTAGDPRLGTFTFTRNFIGRPVGDFNDDSVVDALDYVVWRDSNGELGVNLPADGNLDGKIDSGDYGIWLGHFGQTVSRGNGAGLSPSTAPEPTSIAMFCTAILLIAARRHRQARTL